VIDIPEGKSLANYNFYWFAGVDTLGVPDITTAIGTGTVIEGLDAGIYTIYVVDGTDDFCTSKAQIVRVQDLIELFDMRVDIINDITICYPTMPNGRATIGFIEGDLFRYTFDWYEGAVTDTTGLVPFKSGTSFSVDSLAVAVYTVAAIDLITGCMQLNQFNMLDATVTVGAPSVEKLADRDNCLYPNGEAIARVNGNTEGYIFNWYAPSDLVNPAFIGDRINTLDSVKYLVEAIKISTGCVSARVAIEIGEAFEDPEFKIAVTQSICIRSSDGAFNQFNGTADIFFEQYHEIDSIAWINPEGDIISNFDKLIDAEPGVWSVWFRSDNGCDYTRQFEITTSLKIYNGISANGDGINDYLIIDCIDYFPNNRVSIYNRDGSLVYETKGYNNETDHRFDGFSNVGSKAKQLPVGTYFYFIDKGDGSDVIQGYLELVR
jgi:gliding motility-associated-like protein